MADREKVIEELQKAKEILGKVEEPTFWLDFVQVALRNALELLKEQESKLVKVTKNAYNYEFYDCPNCGRGFELTYYKKPAYCDKCGQAVKWDD